MLDQIRDAAKVFLSTVEQIVRDNEPDLSLLIDFVDGISASMDGIEVDLEDARCSLSDLKAEIEAMQQ